MLHNRKNPAQCCIGGMLVGTYLLQRRAHTNLSLNVGSVLGSFSKHKYVARGKLENCLKGPFPLLLVPAQSLDGGGDDSAQRPPRHRAR
jgi:hypothetical protein